jgi:hypothetical protein
VDIDTTVCVERDVMTCDTVFGVTVLVAMLVSVTVWTLVTGAAVMVAKLVIFDVVTWVVVNEGPEMVTVEDTISLLVIVIAFAAGVIVEKEVVVAVSVADL